MSHPSPDEFGPPDGIPGADAGARRELEAQKEMILKQILEPQARARLGNIKMVKPELANAVENYLIGIGAKGNLPAPITDQQLKQILLSAQQPKRDFKINRV